MNVDETLTTNEVIVDNTDMNAMDANMTMNADVNATVDANATTNVDANTTNAQ